MDSGSWCPATRNVGEFLQLDLQITALVTGIEVEGREQPTASTADLWKYSGYVSRFMVEYSRDAVIWFNLSDGFGTRDKIFSVSRNYRCEDYDHEKQRTHKDFVAAAEHFLCSSIIL